MFHKALWMKEWKHNLLVSAGFLITLLLAYPLMAFMQFETWREWKQFNPEIWEQQKASQIQFIFEPNFFGMILVGLVILLAGFLIGLERNTKRHDFSMALPYSRKEMFITKYALGLLVITISYNIAYWLMYFAVYQSEFAALLSEVNVSQVFWYPLVTYLVIYSFAMFIGTISGEIKSQIALTLIFLFFPQGFLMLMVGFLEVHGASISNNAFMEWITQDLLWPNYLSPFMFDHLNLITPVIAAILFTVLALVIYEKSPSEYSGEFLMFRSLHPLFAFGIPLCSALLGGLFLSSLVPYNSTEIVEITLFWLGALIALFFSWKITKKLLNR
ncbi:ABC-2 type transport system permease protein [Alkalibacillus filiformis]|uniref:ABC-2 type transport system permease protein n=1 Tax=Alkalibacillus filiformis TaxID=200990 RepID=A0ABU0DX67_9BACI|nr:ABC transporter permease subunit [Alkalibacillus filiformis]MDQ0353072.1 ABC-2 type transport system permease protein [Alkalibacillus filiformis]